MPVNFRGVFVGLVFLTLSPLLEAPTAHGQASSAAPIRSAVRNQFVGTWKLISVETRKANGELVPGVNPVGGVNPSGIVMYDASGHVSLQIMPSGRPRYAGSQATPEEAKATLFGYVAYFGTYTVHESEGYIVNHFEGALNPAMIGTDGQRFYEFSANRMTFRPPSTTVAGEQRTTRLTWERLE